jgi:hypothetical protein
MSSWRWMWTTMYSSRDNRSLEQKLRDVVADKGATTGERENAAALLKKKFNVEPGRQSNSPGVSGEVQCTRRGPLDPYCVTHRSYWQRTAFRCERATESRRPPLTREDILRQTAEEFRVNEDDLRAAHDYFSGEHSREAARRRAAWQAERNRAQQAKADLEYAAAQKAARTCVWCKREFNAPVYLEGHKGFCEKNPAHQPNMHTDPYDPTLAACMFCGQRVTPERIAQHQVRCPQRPTAGVRFTDGQKKRDRSGRLFTTDGRPLGEAIFDEFNHFGRAASDTGFEFEDFADSLKGRTFEVHIDLAKDDQKGQHTTRPVTAEDLKE